MSDSPTPVPTKKLSNASDSYSETSPRPIKGRSKIKEYVPTDSQFAKIPDFATDKGFNLELLTTEQTKTFLSTLIDYIYDTVVVKSVSLYGLKFYNRTSSWYARQNGVSEPHDPDYECTGHRWNDCDFAKREPDLYHPDEKDIIQHLTKSPVVTDKLVVPYENFFLDLPDEHKDAIEYQLVYDNNQSNPEKFEVDEDEDSHYTQEERTSQLDRCYLYGLFEETFKKYDPEQYQLLSERSFELMNKQGVNDDHRGSNHTRIVLDFNSVFPLDENPTIMTFAEACYRIKGNKFDYWYELYGGIDLKVDEDTYWIDVGFDHGS